MTGILSSNSAILQLAAENGFARTQSVAHGLAFERRVIGTSFKGHRVDRLERLTLRAPQAWVGQTLHVDEQGAVYHEHRHHAMSSSIADGDAVINAMFCDRDRCFHLVDLIVRTMPIEDMGLLSAQDFRFNCFMSQRDLLMFTRHLSQGGVDRTEQLMYSPHERLWHGSAKHEVDLSPCYCHIDLQGELKLRQLAKPTGAVTDVISQLAAHRSSAFRISETAPRFVATTYFEEVQDEELEPEAPAW